MKTYALAPLPLLGTITVGYVYYLLNIRAELYVHRLGCGCLEGFNTNSLTLIIWGLLIALTLLATIRVSNTWHRAACLPYFIATAFAAVFLTRLFMRYNYWL
jgi:hypothetical protein